MTDKKRIRTLRKEFEKVIKDVGLDNLSDENVVRKSLELEQEMYEYFKEYRQLLAKSRA